MSSRARLVTQRVNIAVDDTDYTIEIPEGATDVRVALNDASLAWRYDIATVAVDGSGMLVSAGGAFVTGNTQMRKTSLHVAVHTGAAAGLYATMSCLVPAVR